MSRASAIAWLAAVASIATLACGGDRLELTSADPPYAPLVGGTRVVLHGAGFGRVGDPIQVLVAGHEAALATVIDDGRLEILAPPGERPGDAEVVVLVGQANARAGGILHYSTAPTIDEVSPDEVLYFMGGNQMTVTGSGFLDEGAGPPTMTLDGASVADVNVIDDRTLTFVAPSGTALVEPELELVNQRGVAIDERAFRYIPSTAPGLLLFPATSTLFAVYYDPVGQAVVQIPWLVSPSVRFTAVMRGDHGEYWGMDRSRRFGRIDLGKQRLDTPIQAQGWFPTMIRDGGAYYAIERSTLRFGRFDPASGTFTAISAGTLPCCGSYGLASDGQVIYYTARSGAQVVLGTIDRDTGTMGSLITLAGSPGLHVEEMRFFAGKLYAVSRDSTLVTIDPKTGVVTPVSALGRFNAMEVYP